MQSRTRAPPTFASARDRHGDTNKPADITAELPSNGIGEKARASAGRAGTTSALTNVTSRRKAQPALRRRPANPTTPRPASNSA